MNLWTPETLEITGGKKGITMQKVPHSYSMQTIQLTFEPGASIAPHSSPLNVLFYVIEGKGMVTIGDEKQLCSAGTYIESPKDLDHGWENQSDSTFKVLVIKLS
ncbi:MAG: cupin domain-containing protein [Fibrobacterales bacterium]